MSEQHAAPPSLPAWRVVAASAIGTSHLKSGQPCQDAWAYDYLPDDSLIIAVADGAGSAAKSHLGSTTVVETALTSLTTQLTDQIPTSEDAWQPIIETAFQAARSALKKLVGEGETGRDYATTLVTVIVTEAWTVGALVGDCVAVTLDPAGELAVLCVPQKGEYANSTNFLTQENALEVLDIQVKATSITGVAVFSDGLQSVAMNIAHNKPHAPFFNPLFSFAMAAEDESASQEQLTNFLNSERINARTDDDKTIVLARRMDAPPTRKS